MQILRPARPALRDRRSKPPEIARHGPYVGWHDPCEETIHACWGWARMNPAAAPLEAELTPFSLGLLEAAPDPILVCTREGTVVLLNERAEEVFGHAREHLIGKHIEVLMPTRFRDRHRRHREQFAQTPKTRPMGSGLELVGLRRDGTEFPAEISLSPLATERGPLIISIVRDVTERKALEKELWYRCTHDELTGLYNRAFFEAEKHRLQDSRQFPVSVLLSDIDGLKRANDRGGHAAGDRLLRGMAEVLRRSFRADEIVARIGGDEFAALLPHTDASTLPKLQDRIRREGEKWNSTESATLEFSLGAATAEKRNVPLDSVVRAADIKMYANKRERYRARGL